MKTVFAGLFLFFSYITLFAQDSLSNNKSSVLISDKNPHKGKNRELVILPIIYKSPETGFAAGVAGMKLFKFGKDSLTRTSNIEVVALYSQRKQILFDPVFILIFPKENYILRGFGGFNKFSEFYYGVGNNIQKKERKAIAFNYTQIHLRFMKRIKGRNFVGLQYQFYNVGHVKTILENPKVNSSYIINRSLTSGMGLSYTFDSRDNVVNPFSGQYLDVSNLNFIPAFGSRHTFYNVTIDGRKYFKLKSRRDQIVAFQLIGNFNGGMVPFRQLAYVGGSRVMRGLYNGMYRDNDMIALQGEYRLHLKGRFGITAFGGLAQVEKEIHDFNFKNIRGSYGTGLRFMVDKKERVNLRLDLGFNTFVPNFSKYTSGLYIQIGEAF